MVRIYSLFFKAIFFVILLFLNSTLVYADTRLDTWKLVKEDKANDIAVYYRTLESGNVEFKGVTHISTSLSSFVALLKDFDTLPEWAYRTKRVVKLKQINSKEMFVYTIHPMPWPFRSRDAVFYSYIEQNPETSTVIVKGRTVPDYIPGNDDHVRISNGESFWQLTPNGGGTIEVIFQGYGEPGGSVSPSIYRSILFRSLVKLYLWKLPYKTLKRVRHHVQQEKYHQERFYFIQEPPPGKVHQVLSQDFVNSSAVIPP